jgi:hypothetical protein
VPTALELVYKQVEKARSRQHSPRCSRAFETIYGMPCCHTIASMIHINCLIDPGDFHYHWLFNRPGAPTVAEPSEPRDLGIQPSTVLEPRTVQGRGRPRKDNTTRRDLSMHERGARGRGRRRQTVTALGTAAASVSASGPSNRSIIDLDAPDSIDDFRALIDELQTDGVDASDQFHSIDEFYTPPPHQLASVDLTIDELPQRAEPSLPPTKLKQQHRLGEKS